MKNQKKSKGSWWKENIAKAEKLWKIGLKIERLCEHYNKLFDLTQFQSLILIAYDSVHKPNYYHNQDG